MYPTLSQKKILKKWHSTCRYVYNKGLADIKSGNSQINFQSLRNKFVTKQSRDGVRNPNVLDWELETPKEIRATALSDLTKAYDTAFTNLKRRNIQKFRMNFKRKKTDTSSIGIPQSAIKNNQNGTISIYATFMAPIKVANDKRIRNQEILHDCRISEKHGKWFLCVPIRKSIHIGEKGVKVVALDPGVRKIQTAFSENEIIQFRQNPKLLVSLQKKISKLQSLRSKHKITNSHFKRGIHRVYSRSDNLIDELHFQTIAYLKKRYNLIFLPSFESQEMVKGGLGRRFNRNILSLKHYKFKQRFKSACLLERYVDIKIVSEPYTSQTCICGKLTKTSKELFRCKWCGFECDRDILGARNILLKSMDEIIPR